MDISFSILEYKRIPVRNGDGWLMGGMGLVVFPPLFSP